MADSAYTSELRPSSVATAATVPAAAIRHTATVRVTHWVVALCFLALLAQRDGDRHLASALLLG